MTDSAGQGDEALRIVATSARNNAYAPYTKFDAGAAVLDTAGNIYAGSLIENISLGLAMCAERVALFTCASSGGRPVHVVLAAPSTDSGLTVPCGACLQVALELGGPTIQITAIGDAGEHSSTVIDLLPRGPHRLRTGVK
jgi:cytidine deaminase